MVPGDVDAILTLIWQFGLIGALILTFYALRLFAESKGRWSETLQSRFIKGVPWGSFISISTILLFYLVVQRGMWHWHDPVTIAFTASSFFNPMGILTAGFAHSSPGHLTNNLTGALLLAPLAEFVWGHYPDTDAPEIDSWFARPYLRAFVIFPGAIFLTAILTGIFAWGPVIGFSGVVFALAGFTLVKYPIVTVLALLGRSVVRTVFSSLTDPIIVTEATATFSRPSWAGIAVQGHAFGLLLGVAVGAYVLWRRDERTDPVRLWVGTVLAGMTLSLWAFWWIRGSETYVLYRALGVTGVLILSLIITAALVSSDKPLWGTLTYRQTAVLLLFVPLLTMSLVAIPLNMNVVSMEPNEQSVVVEDYYIYYDRGVQDQMISVVNVTVLGESTNLPTDGVIIASEDRHIWQRSISTSQLAFYGEQTVVIGGLTWRDTVHIERKGWNPVGGDRVYQVWFTYDDERSVAYESEMQRVEPVIDDHLIYIVAEGGLFYIEVYADDSIDRTPVPPVHESVTVAGLTITNDDGSLYAETDTGTNVRIADRERYYNNR